MSNLENTKILEEAQELISYWEGTTHAQLLRKAVVDKDYDHLFEQVRTSRLEMLRQEYNPLEVDNV